ncbi:MAG: hypothetical protein E6Q88_00335 [Lysobacteraceae bacterium]|nr:MAG: hypothetical protein E6Q88_00335 [Xanthomonadaceae bacterium]
MSKAAFTIKAFAVYMLALGVILVLIPNVVLAMFGLPTTSEVWIRVVGLLVFNIGVYYWFAAVSEARAFFRASVFTRVLVLVAFATFAALDLVDPPLILFGVADFVGGIWTFFALRQDARGA